MTKTFLVTLAVGLAGATIASQTPAAPVRFEVASVKPNTSTIPKTAIQAQPGGRFTAINVTLRQLTEYAYQLQDFQIAGGPGWLTSDRFDILATAEGADPGRQRLMLRALLAERFKLEQHTESRELPIYALMPARADGAPGAQLKRSPRECDAADCLRVFPGTIQAGGARLSQLADTLSTLVGRSVRDRTGWAGGFEFTLRWTPDQIPPGYQQKASAMGLPPIDADGPSIFTAVREQLGLKLEPQKGPVDVLIVDRAEHPTYN